MSPFISPVLIFLPSCDNIYWKNKQFLAAQAHSIHIWKCFQSSYSMKASTPRCFQPLYSESCSEGIFGALVKDNPTTVDKYMIFANIFNMFRIKILFCVSDKEKDQSSLTVWMEGTVTIMLWLHKAAFFDKPSTISYSTLPSFQSFWSEEGCHVTLLLMKFWKVLGSVQSATDAPAFTVLLQL